MLAGATINNYWVTWFPGSILATLGVLALMWKAVGWLNNAVVTMKQVQVALPMIQAEFVPNHGSSMKDRVEALHDKKDAESLLINQHISADAVEFAYQHEFNDKVYKAGQRRDRQLDRQDAALERIEDYVTRPRG
jgi:hypothetical protein